MKRRHTFLFLLITAIIISSILLMPVKPLFDFKPSNTAQLTMLTQSNTCPNHISTSLSCTGSTSVYWIQTESDLMPETMFLVMAGVLFFILLFSRYKSPVAELFRPPIYQ